MRRLLCLVLLCLLALPAACDSPAPAGKNAAADEVAVKEDFREWLRDAIKDDPAMIMDVLAANNETVFHIVDEGFRVAQNKAQLAQRLNQLEQGIMPRLDDSRPSIGPDNATITVVEFSDFQCPYCSQAARTLELLQLKYADSMRVFFKHMPLSSHQHAQSAAALFEAASLQDEAKAWELYHRYFQGQEQIKDGGMDWLLGQAREVGLDVDRLNQDAASNRVLTRIKEDVEDAQRFGLQGTPSFIINGVTVSGALSLEEFTALVEFVLQNDPRLQPGATPPQ
ncbi:DsbA family protein [Megalodesulfovibrio gigas]|uniref:Putative DSBA-like thioredoxin domain-containing protein n=1 Tax=Megalodesulfovibrio gigas (strain ATCC 19364 / DSM 1382 / NCIMB 9332 / VKM B-1759) TaxID=1121448 RepID=T2G7Q4_MEGG1|nr:thioredoxin domain-containing protein [Megalodesulfovibrio gigas]AGW12323.1 putative DSBA-like thioredoxin domain-containing protein [Megalodesulfovibrio gigas DSM 1382 = ATCC 19364]